MTNERLKVKILRYDDLTEEEKYCVSENGSGAIFASYLKVIYDGETLLLKSDAMEPEDAGFDRDLSWISGTILMAYRLGREDKEEK